MTTIITIVVVALVFFVTICVVAFMIWKRETEMRTDSIKAIEYNVEEMLYELTGSSSREIRRGRVKRGEEAGKEQGGAQQEISEKRDEVDRHSENDAKGAQDPFGWMRKESVQDTGRREENADAEVKARENITVFEPAAVQHEPYERRRSGAAASNASRYGLRWTEVTAERRGEPQEGEPDGSILPESEAAPATVAMSEPTMTPEADAMSEPVMTPEEEPMSVITPMPAMTPMNMVETPAMQESPQAGSWSQITGMQPQQAVYPQQQIIPPQPQQVIQQPEQPRDGGMIAKLLKRRKKPKDPEEQQQRDVPTERPKQDPLYGWVENYEARNMHRTYDSPDAYETQQEEELYAPYGENGRADANYGHAVDGYEYFGTADAWQADPEVEWKEKTVEDLLKEYIDEHFEPEDADVPAPAKMGYNIGKSGRKYTVEELETLIKE